MNIQALLKVPMTTGELLSSLRARLEPVAAKGTYISEHMPELVQATIANAEEAYKGMMVLPGTGGVREFVGNPPYWLERRHNDNEFLWQLNRMTHWQDLLEAYTLTRDDKYGRKVIEEMLDWIETIDIREDMVNYPIEFYSQCHPLRALELGIRNYHTWPLVLEHLGPTDLFTEELLEAYLGAVYKQIKILRKVSPILWPKADHNHFLMECLGILTTALYFPELKEAEEWKSFAIHGIERCVSAQLTEDGGQIEGCPSYHNGCMFWFGLAVVLSKRFHFQFSDAYLKLLRKNLDYSLYSLRPTGKCIPVGDSTAKPIAVIGALYGYLALDDSSWLGLAANLIDYEKIIHEVNKHIWRALDVKRLHEELLALQGNPYECDKLTTFWNRTLHQAIIRTGWHSEALSFLFTCRSPVQNAHAHIDLMSFDFTALGKNMVCDPGIFCYREDDDRRQFKSASYHSTLLIDERDHFEYLSSWEYGPQKTGEIYNVEHRGFYQIASAFHLNYEPAVHYRHIALVDDKMLVIVDRVKGLDDQEVERYFHLDYTEVAAYPDVVLATSHMANLAIYSYPWEAVDLLPGRLSDEHDVARAATRVRFRGKQSGTAVYLTVLVPYQGDQRPVVDIRPMGDASFELSCSENYQVIVNDRDMTISCGRE
ncbi:alginate lyase family protein [Paenibacillus roseipurpureus]|uniref:Heparinase II/III family protein n=1 Tax=Paenibacillus roseopurpureus TaxID=2918901 RepID=A0AA96LL10_9BACL|nr:heparinase II/III family protein [Paenibacillus sp. MBLB1832]WNR43036.1 heparinase II/III family protein [Paenibacillus sp. MBLB1832]